MAYAFKRTESVAKAIRRLGHERIGHALECLRDGARAEAIHGARKDIKKTRAVLRLVRRRVAKTDFRRLKKTLREAAAHLAAPRDAYIKTQTLRHLTKHIRSHLASKALRPARAELRKEYEKEMALFEKKETASAGRSLQRLMEIWGQLKVEGKGWTALCPGVQAAYRRGRRAFLLAAKDSSAENCHAWRKRLKDLGYQVRLLRPASPEQLDAMAEELETLADILGDDHDLAVLSQDLARRSVAHRYGRDLETLRGLIEERQHGLRAAALSLGARFYAENPSTFCERLGKFWQTWRSRSAA